jgi:outer membrane cobalamin receptor
MRASSITLAILAAFASCERAAGATLPDDLLAMSIEELSNIDVSASSLLPATLLSAASSITSVMPQEWERIGARRTWDALSSTPGVVVMPHSNGNQVMPIRGYERLTSFTGVAVTLDGVPLTDLYRSSPQYSFPGINLGVLAQIQLIQGPGSALYGSDAFHGLLALRTHGGEEADRQGSVTAGHHGYYEAAARSAHAFGDGGRWSAAFATNGQGNQARTAEYGHPT